MTKLIKFAGQQFELHREGALWMKEYKVMVVSDIQLEKQDSLGAIAYSRQGHGCNTLQKLKRMAEKLQPEKIIILGDLFDKNDAIENMPIDHIDALYLFLKKYKVIWVEGCHNAGFSPPNIDMRIEYAYLNLTFRHIASDQEHFEISGHYQPCVEIDQRGKKLRRQCFIADKTKLILPSFSGNCGGLSIHDSAIQNLFNDEIKIYPMSPKKVYKIAQERIIG